VNTQASTERTPPTPNRLGRHARRRLFAAPLAVLALLCVAGLAGSAIAASAASPTPIAPPTSMMFGNQLTGVACPSTSQCTAVDIAGQQVTFDPASPGSPTPTTIDANTYLWSVACPSTSQCAAVDDYESGHEVTFDPSSPGSPTPTANNGGVGMYSVACPSASQCTAVDNLGHEVTFDPASPGSPTATTIDGSNNLDSVACPSTSQCTAVDIAGHQVTFDPASPGSPTPTTIFHNTSGYYSVACPSRSQCTAVDQDNGQEVTFDPASPGSPTPTTIAVGGGVACPSTSQCTAVGGGQEVTFDPTSVGTPTATTIDNISGLDAVACPSASQCTAVDRGGNEVTFNPRSVPASVPPPVLGKSVDAAPVSGVVLLKQPGKRKFVRLRAGQRIPLGSTIDTTHGRVQLTSAKDKAGHTTTGVFYAGVFRLTQVLSQGAEITVLTLAGPKPSGCSAASSATVARRHSRKRVRKRSLWGNSKGDFRTKGAYASATERGTRWLTQDTCAGTLIHVTQGEVTVDDLPHHRTLLLKAPRSYLAHRGKGG
jgi:hypothetical protein